MPVGTPPNGFDTSAEPATRYAHSRSRWQNAFSRDASIAAKVASSSSVGDRSPLRKASTSEQASPVQGASVTAGIFAPAPAGGPTAARQQGGSAPSRGIVKVGLGTGGPFGSCTATASTMTNGPCGTSGAGQNADRRPSAMLPRASSPATPSTQRYGLVFPAMFETLSRTIVFVTGWCSTEVRYGVPTMTAWCEASEALTTLPTTRAPSSSTRTP